MHHFSPSSKACNPGSTAIKTQCYANSQDDTRWINELNYPISFPKKIGNPHVWARARPQATTAPVVLHVIDWDLPADSIQFAIQPSRFFPSGEVGRIEAFTAIDYQSQMHQWAATHDDYQALHQSIQIHVRPLLDGRLHIQLPLLKWHWAPC